MYLKQLEIQGFKSFADAVQFQFSEGVTAIVGPNGSGKSNVVDAVRWVLGEQSAKTLRGGKMEDVIFSGSSDRKPLGMARVSLTLDNSGGIFPLDYREVTITRILYRSGESNYQINGKNCRLRDVQELFMDTGLGKDGFSVIGQGKIDEILTLKAEERRGLIEEAAGISKYKYRKKTASHQLERNQEDLLRLKDILIELEERLEPLEQQAKDVKCYQNYEKEYRELSLSLIKDKYQKTLSQKELLGEKYLAEKQRFAALQEEFTQKEEALLSLKSRWQTHRQELSASQEEYLLEMGIYEEKQRLLSNLKERKSASFERQKDLESRLCETEERCREQKEYLSNIQAEKIEKQAEYNSSKKRVDELFQQKQSQEKELAEIEHHLEQFQNNLYALMREEVTAQNNVTAIDQSLVQLEHRKKRQSHKAEEIRREAALKNQEIVALKKEHNEIQLHYEEQVASLKALEEQIFNQEASYAKISSLKEKISKEYTQKKSRLETLEEMELTGQGYYAGVQAILKAKSEGKITGIAGSVAQLIKVPEHLNIAIENALGASLQHLVTEDDKDAQAAINYLKTHRQGRATFLPLNTIKGGREKGLPKEKSILGYGVDLIEYDAHYEAAMVSLLGKVVIVQDLSSAVSLMKKKIVTERMVTLEGEVVSPKGSLSGGSQKKDSILLKRNTERQKIEKELDAILNQGKQLNSELEKYEKELNDARQKLQIFQEEMQHSRLILQEVETKLEGKKIEEEHFARTVALEDADEKQLSEELLVLNQERKEALENQNKAEEEIALLRQNKEKYEVERTALETVLKTLSHSFTKNNEAFLVLKEQLIQLERQENLEIERKKSLERSCDQLQEERNTIENQKENLVCEISALKSEQKEKQEQLKFHQESVKLLTASIEKEEEELTLLEKETKDNSTFVQQQEKLLQQLSSQIERNREHFEELTNQLKVDYDLEPENLEQIGILTLPVKEAEKNINRLKKAMQDLGQLNFKAIEEFEEVSSRVLFMREQMSDLEIAEENLKKLIREMEEVMSQRFRDTYEKTNELFNEIFQGMFQGGSARLELSIPKDYLETGVDIIAQPPGKKERNLSLLSGGERAMTAIALLFALLNIRPSPFVILDEIEAALDEANVDRLAEFIKNYSEKSQFIVISHRKGTMEASHILYGVTMDRNGVSKLLSVKLEDYIKE